MCVSPLNIPRNSGPAREHHLQGLYRRIGEPFRDYISVPCGHCTECLKRRQNDLAVRCQREAASRGSMCFLTLTYDEENLPLSCRLVRTDLETGEMDCPYPAFPLVRSGDDNPDSVEFVRVCRNDLMLLKPGSKPRIVEKVWFTDEQYEYRFLVTPSLYRRDVRLWLKRCRVRYLREKGQALPDFSYVVCGELGPRTCRPHYHVCFFGLSLEQVQWCAGHWNFGFWNLKQVNAVNKDGTNGFEIAARYIGKYVTKGKFECESVKDRLCEKPRLMLSKFLGADLPDSLVSYYRCYDLFGKYDINSLIDSATGRVYSREKLLEMSKEIAKRAHIDISGHSYVLPRSLTIKLWYVYSDSQKAYVASDLRTALQAVVHSDPIGDYIELLRKVRPGISARQISDAVVQFIALHESRVESQERFDENALYAFYARSIF